MENCGPWLTFTPFPSIVSPKMHVPFLLHMSSHSFFSSKRPKNNIIAKEFVVSITNPVPSPRFANAEIVYEGYFQRLYFS